jgi:hypothetical protein
LSRIFFKAQSNFKKRHLAAVNLEMKFGSFRDSKTPKCLIFQQLDSVISNDQLSFVEYSQSKCCFALILLHIGYSEATQMPQNLNIAQYTNK